MCVYDGVCSCVRERTREQRAQKKEKKKSVCLLIYDAVSVINTTLLSHLDALIDTCSGEHMGQELELRV